MTVYGVSGASGRLGRAVVGHLCARVGAAAVVGITRHPAPGAPIRLRRGGYDDEESLARAYDGVDRLLLVSAGYRSADGLRARQHATALAAARRAGVHHVVYTSLTGADSADPQSIVADHAETEADLQRGGLPATILRNNVYSEMVLRRAAAAVATGRWLTNSGSAGGGATAYLTREDCAAVAAAVMAGGRDEVNGHGANGHGETGHGGVRVLEVGGSNPRTDAEVAQILAAATGRRIVPVEIGDDEAAEHYRRLGVPEPTATGLARYDAAARSGARAVRSDLVRRATGREPVDLPAFLAAHRGALVAG